MKLSFVRSESRRSRSLARDMLKVARLLILKAKVAEVFGGPYAPAIAGYNRLRAVSMLLAAGNERAKAKILAEEYRARSQEALGHCDACDGCGSGHSRFGEWICSPCMGFGQLRRAA